MIPRRPCDLVTVFGGDGLQERSAGRLTPWSTLHEEPWL